MNAIQRNRQYMGTGVSGTLNSYSPAWSGSPLVSAAVNQHAVNLDDINTCQVQQQVTMTIKGLSQNKEFLRSLIIEQLIKFIGSIKAYATETNQFPIGSSVNYSPSQLQSMSATGFRTAAMQVHQVAADNSAALIPYGITVAANTTLSNDINMFELAFTTVKQAKADSKTATANLAKAVKKMMIHLKDSLDNHIKQYKGSDLFIAYFNSRKIYDYNRNIIGGLQGRITDSSNGEIISNGLLEMVLTGRSLPVKITKKGEFKIKTEELTGCTLRIRVAHYMPAEYDIALSKGKVVTFNIALTPEPVINNSTLVTNNSTVAAS